MDLQEQEETPVNDISDRERLQALARQKVQEKNDAEVRRRRLEAEEHQRRIQRDAEAEQKTQEILRYCECNFKGFSYEATNHVVEVTRQAVSRSLRLDANGGVQYVVLLVQHVSDWAGHVPLVAARFHDGAYELVVTKGKSKVNTFKELCERMMEELAELANPDAMRSVFKAYRETLGMIRRR